MENGWKKWNLWIKKKLEGQNKIKWSEVGYSKLIIIILVGVFLLVLSLPSGFLSGNNHGQIGKKTEKKCLSTENSADSAWSAMSEYAYRQERETEKVLSQVEGIGSVKVMLTIASSEEKRTLQQEENSVENNNETDSEGGSRLQNRSTSKKEPVLVEEGEEKTPYIIKLESPEIEGVVVVAQGAGRGTMDSQIIEAVSALFSLEPHKIKVMKMK